MNTIEPGRSRTLRTTTSPDGVDPRTAPVTAPYPGRDGSVPDGEQVPGATDHHDAVSTSAPARRDRVRWGPVWAGLLVTLSTFLLLEVMFFALGWLTFAQGEPGATAGWISGVIGLFAFFLGGLSAGATAMWRGTGDGLLHGILVWALGVVGIIFLTLFGGGALFGSLADVFAQVTSLRQLDLSAAQASQALGTARSSAGWASLGLGLSITAAALGGLAGAKMWPRRQDATSETTRDTVAVR